MIQSRGCPCSGKSLPRLLRPGIMAFLAYGEAHGYQIAQHLSGMRMFGGREPDHPGLCLGGKKACPPEDCGGIWGYYHLTRLNPCTKACTSERALVRALGRMVVRRRKSLAGAGSGKR